MGTGALSEAELDRLAEFLGMAKGGKAMNLEELDGFFSALIAGPEVVLPSEYLPEVFGGDMSQTFEFAGIDQANQILGLMIGTGTRLPPRSTVEMCIYRSCWRIAMA